MLAVLGVLILAGMLSAVGYNRLTALYNEALRARERDGAETESARAAADAYEEARKGFPLSVVAALGRFGALPEG